MYILHTQLNWALKPLVAQSVVWMVLHQQKLNLANDLSHIILLLLTILIFSRSGYITVSDLPMPVAIVSDYWYTILDTPCWIHCVGYAVLDTPRWIRCVGYAVLDMPCWIRRVRYAVLDTPCWIRRVEYTVLDTLCQHSMIALFIVEFPSV